MWEFEHAVRLREVAIAAGLDLPLYLLAPEVAVLLSYLPDMHQRVFFETLWNTGARPDEAAALTPNDFFFHDQLMPFVRLRTLKQRQAPRRRVGRPSLESQKEEEKLPPLRAVPLPDVGLCPAGAGVYCDVQADDAASNAGSGDSRAVKPRVTG
ncbi:phage_integrase domain-containing protein [Trichonephila clavipes]|nr:phage_integrase domain-containing protein [Trichonephila clavipes]